MLSLLYFQQRLYISELGKSHHTLSQLYRKLEKIERELSEWKDRGLTRKDKKRLQWDRAIARSSLRHLEADQALLRDHLQQCNDSIASYNATLLHNPPMPCVSSLSPMAYPFTPTSPFPATPWTAGPFEERTTWGPPEPQYWDLSMLREPRQPLSTHGSPDSGFYEPTRQTGWFEHSGFAAGYEARVSDQVEVPMTSSFIVATPSNRSSRSEKDALPELMSPSSPAKLGAEGPTSPHRRRYSENAIQLIESHLELSRGSRVGSAPPSKRTVSETRVSKED